MYGKTFYALFAIGLLGVLIYAALPSARPSHASSLQQKEARDRILNSLYVKPKTICPPGNYCPYSTDADLSNFAQSLAPKDRPVIRMYEAYRLYSYTQFCHQLRDGYALIYISDPEMQRAKQAIKAIEADLPELDDDDLDVIWNKASKANHGL